MKPKSRLRDRILGKTKTFIDEKLNTVEIKEAITNLREANSSVVNSAEIWACSVCSKSIAAKDYAKHYFKCFSKSVMKGKIPEVS